MPNCDFYAVEDDLINVLDVVFSQADCRIFEMYSPFGQELMEFRTTQDISDRYTLGKCQGNSPSVMLQLLPNNARGQVKIEKVTLKPEKCGGHTFRYKASGWGLIQLYLGGVSSAGIVHSHTDHNSEKRAKAWEATYPEMGPASNWDWKAITLFSSRLNRIIRNKLAVTKEGARVVLPHAMELINNGARLV
jgi:hypothetical protein